MHISTDKPPNLENFDAHHPKFEKENLLDTVFNNIKEKKLKFKMFLS